MCLCVCVRVRARYPSRCKLDHAQALLPTFSGSPLAVEMQLFLVSEASYTKHSNTNSSTGAEYKGDTEYGIRP